MVEHPGTTQQSVCGVRIARPDGQFEFVRSGRVVLACNGYGANPALMQRFIPEMAEAHYYGHAGNTGDAVLWGEKLGAPLRHMAAYQGHGSLAAGHNILITWALMMAGGVQVNQLGERFSNEHAGYSEQAVCVMSQPDSIAWNIYDQRLHQLGMTFPDYQQAAQAGAIVRAADSAALAASIQVPRASLQATLQEAASLSAQNAHDRFGRRFNSAEVLQAPYYAVKVAPAVFHTQGGLTVDRFARVLGSEGQCIANLLAAGGAACGVSGSTVAGYLSGNGLLCAVALGVIAADTVTGELLGNKGMKIAVLGGGNGSYASAVDLTEQGHEVRLWRRDQAAVERLRERRNTLVLKDFQGERDVTLALVTPDLVEAVQDAALIVCPVPATAQADIAAQLATCLCDGQVVFLPPGSFGSCMMAKRIHDAGNRADIVFAEAGTLPYLTRKHGEFTVALTTRATRLPTGVFPVATSRTGMADPAAGVSCCGRCG